MPMAKEEPGTYSSWSASDNIVNPSRVVTLSSGMDSGVLRELLDTSDVSDWPSSFVDYGLTNPGFFETGRPPSHSVGPWAVPHAGYVTSPPGEVLPPGASAMVTSTPNLTRNPGGMADVSGPGSTGDRSKGDAQNDGFGWGGPYYRDQRSGSGGMVSSPTSSGAGSGGEGRDAQVRPGGPKGRNVKVGMCDIDSRDRDGRMDGRINRSQDTQRRYRERQKAKTADLLRKVEILTETNDQLQDENKRLQAERNTLLSLLNSRASQPQTPQQFPQQQQQQQQRQQMMQPQQQSRAPNNPQLQPPPHQNGRNASDGDSLADALAESLTLTVQDPPIRLSPEQLKFLSHPDLTVLWKEYVNTLARLLVTVDPIKGAPAGLVERIDQLTKEALALLTLVSFPNPRGVKTFVASKLEDEVVSRDEGSDWWLEAVDKLHLTVDQKGAATRLRVGYLEKLDQVLQTREEVFTRLLRAQPSRLSTRITAANYLMADGVLCQLRESMNMENELVCDFITRFYQILTPIQRAQYVVQAWPWTPDHLAFCTAVAAQLGDKDAHGLLTGALSSTRSRDPSPLLLAQRSNDSSGNMPEG